MSETGDKAIVIGAGVAGLAAAIRLAVKGYAVEVWEARHEPGGKLHAFRLGNFRFDAGPSLFTLPHLVTDLFRLAGKDPSLYFRYYTFAEACRYFWNDGTVFHAPSDPGALAWEAARVFGVEAEQIGRYLSESRALFDSAGQVFFENHLARWSTWTHPRIREVLRVVSPRHLFSSLHANNARHFRDPRLVQLFDRFATYNGSDPFRTPAMMQMIAALEHGTGVHLPEGGMVRITEALYRLAEELGVRFRFDTRVTGIDVARGKVRGVRAGNLFQPADIVACNMDIWFTYQQLLPGERMPFRVRKAERSTSALVFYWGMDATFDRLGLHNIFFSGDYREEFRRLFRGISAGQDPTIYVHISSKAEPDDAPQGGENWFVMVNAPRHEGQDWARERAVMREAVIGKLERLLGRSVRAHIREERVWDPAGIEADTLSYQGALYGSSSNHPFSAFLRHDTKNAGIKGLFHIGGTVHPGGGIPLCLMSAAHMDARVPAVRDLAPQTARKT